MKRRMNQFIKNFMSIIFSLLSTFLAFLIPRNKNQILIGAMSGTYYGDNSKYVYESLCKRSRGLNFHWVTRSKKVYMQLKKNKHPVVSAYSLKGIWSLYRSRVAIYTNGVGDLSFHGSFVPKRLKLIALRHGRSVKGVRFAAKNQKFTWSEKFVLNRETAMIQCAISTSDFVSTMQEKVLQVRNQVVTGYPRNDFLFDVSSEVKEKWIKFLGGEDFKKVILYGPTWRHGRNPTQFFPFPDFKVSELNDLLNSHQILILIRPHKNELNNQKMKEQLETLCNEVKNIKFATHEDFQSVNDMIPFCDALITDFSALYHDYLLLNRPLIFIPYDYANFEKENGFLYDYYKYLPGPAVHSLKELLHEVENIANNRDAYEHKRAILTDLIHKYKDNKSTERVIQLILNLLEEEKK